jgi:hypothetical protein
MTSTSTSTSTTSTSSSTTGVGPTAGDSDGGSSGGPATLCEQYCAAKAACSIAFPNCLQDCIDITGVAAGTDAQCSGSLDAVVECRLALTCEELQTAIASGGLVGCTEQTTALAQTCITETCDGYCTLAEQCQAGGGGPNGDCGLSCAVQSVLAPLDAGGAMCLFAFDDALDCLGNLMDCTEFNDAVNGQGPCSEELGLVSMVCPMGA